MGAHREDVDVSRYPWSAIGKLVNETGASCSGVVIAHDKILTAAHCLYNARARRFITAEALHFLVGYRTGRYSAHARVASYQIGPGFDPLRYTETSNADWAILTMTEPLPSSIEPLKLTRDFSPTGTRAVMAGYPQDRAHAMTADSDCELGEKVDGGQLYLNTCRGVSGYSGAPILVQDGSREVRVAGIQIAMFKANGTQRMLAVPVQSITQLRAPGEVQPTKVAELPSQPVAQLRSTGEKPPTKGVPALLPAIAASCNAPAAIAFDLLKVAPVAGWRDDTLFGDERLPQYARLATAALL